MIFTMCNEIIIVSKANRRQWIYLFLLTFGSIEIRYSMLYTYMVPKWKGEHLRRRNQNRWFCEFNG